MKLSDIKRPACFFLGGYSSAIAFAILGFGALGVFAKLVAQAPV